MDWPAAQCVHEWIAAHARATPDAPAVGTAQHGWTTYAELQAAVEGAAAALAGADVVAGDHVVLALPSSAVSIAFGFAAQSLGAALVEINRELGAEGFAVVLGQTGARVAVVQGRDVNAWAPLARSQQLAHLFVVHEQQPPERMSAVLDGVDWTWVPERLDLEQLPAGGGGDAPARSCDHDATALLVYTSGSTGTPRAVIQTHGNIDANSRAIARYLELTPDDRVMATLPLFYCYGRSLLQTHLLVGGSIFFDHRFMYPKVVVDEMVAQRCTGFAGVPLTFESLKRHVDIAATDLGALRYVTQAGGAMHPDTISWVREAFAPAVLFVMYGQTEATSRLAYLPPDQATAKAGSAGRALDNIELAVVDDAGARLAPDVVGNVVARGPSITPGYFEAPAETAEILHDGWLWTGDLGRIDADGYVFLTGRTKEFLKLAGNRVSPHEIEEVLARHPAVAEVAVAGGKDSNGAEHAVAFVVAAPGGDADEAALRRHCREAMPAYKVPTRVRFVEALPVTASRKIARTALQEWIADDPSLLS